MGLKNFFLSIRTKKSLRLNKTERLSTPFSKVKSIGILFSTDGEEKLNKILSFGRQLEALGKSVDFLEFMPKVKKTTVFSGLPWFSMKDIDLWGIIRNKQEEKFAGSGFDYLFVADPEPNPVILNVLARSKASCRVGQSGPGRTPFLDFMIQPSVNGQDLLAEMLNYTQKLS